MCLAQGPQRSDAGEAGTRGPLVSSQALYHWAIFDVNNNVNIMTRSKHFLHHKELDICIVVVLNLFILLQKGWSWDRLSAKSMRDQYNFGPKSILPNNILHTCAVAQSLGTCSLCCASDLCNQKCIPTTTSIRHIIIYYRHVLWLKAWELALYVVAVIYVTRSVYLQLHL